MVHCSSNSSAKQLANIFLNEIPSGLWLLSAPKGAGKTTFCGSVIDAMRTGGASVGGILCPAVFAEGEKVGIDQVHIATGERRRLGVRAGQADESTVGRWQLDQHVLAWGNEILAGLQNENLIVIDELGPLELQAGDGYQEGVQLLDEGRYQTALVVVRPTLLLLAQQRWPQAQVVQLEGARP